MVDLTRLRREREWFEERLKSRGTTLDLERFDQIDAEGVPLGILPDFDFEAVKTEYSAGDILLLFTDGLSEAMSPTREQFGYDRIQDIVTRLSESSADDILAELYRSIEEHAAGKPQHDDTTVIVLKAI